MDREYQMILRYRNAVGDRSRLIDFIIEPHLLNDSLHQRTGICLVVYSEIRLKTESISLRAQDTCEDRVECSHLQIAYTLVAHQASYALLHLAGSLIGKR